MPDNDRPRAGSDVGQWLPDTADRRDRLLAAWLAVRVYLDVLRLDPVAFLKAVGWRLRGFKVRSRNRLAPLAGQSSSAYRLWIVRDEPATMATLLAQSEVRSSAIVPVIDCRAGMDGIAATMASLAGQAPLIITIGGDGVAGATRIADSKNLREVVGPNGAWLCPIDAGDRLAPQALTLYGHAATGDALLIYADDDLIDRAGRRSCPHFKPDWNPDLFGHHDFLTGSAVIRAAPTVLATLTGPDWAGELVRGLVADGARPRHVPAILHHRRKRPAPVVPTVPVPAGPARPLVSAIIPTRNHVDLLRHCIDGLRRTDYTAIETIIVDNGSDDPSAIAYLQSLERAGMTVLRQPGPFNYSALNNAAVLQSSGDLLCFLNNDVEMPESGWLAPMVRQALRPEVGAVGARLLYPDGTIQHAGVFIGIGGGAGHGHRFQHHDDPGYFERSRLPQQVSAVTAACLVVDRSKFLAVDGFDERSFPVAFNDIDLCLKLNAAGWQSFYEPRATLIHHESKSRGSDRARSNRQRFAGELAALKAKWRTDERTDPYHHPHLSRFSEQFQVAV